jgi:hypothetical protein
MKTLIESTETSATYEFSHDTAVRTVTYETPEGAEAPDFEALSEADYQAWRVWLGVAE